MHGMVTIQRMTAQEYLANPDETVRSELVEGEVIVHGPTPTHQIVLCELLVAIHAWTAAASGRGAVMLPLDVLIDERNVSRPTCCGTRKAARRGEATSDRRRSQAAAGAAQS